MPQYILPFQTFNIETFVFYNEHQSHFIVRSKVPQGSNLAPLPILLPIIDLGDHIECNKLYFS